MPFEVCAGNAPATLPDVEQSPGVGAARPRTTSRIRVSARAWRRESAALRRNWKAGFDVEARARWLARSAPIRDCACLHRVGRAYEGRRPDALRSPPWVTDDTSFAGLARVGPTALKTTLCASTARGGRCRTAAEDVAVPDPGLAPHPRGEDLGGAPRAGRSSGAAGRSRLQAAAGIGAECGG